MDISLQAQGHQGLSDLRAFAQAVTSALHRAPTSSAYRKLCPDPQTWSDQRLTASPPSGGNYPRPGGGVNRTNVESTPTTGRALCLRLGTPQPAKQSPVLPELTPLRETKTHRADSRVHGEQGGGVTVPHLPPTLHVSATCMPALSPPGSWAPGPGTQQILSKYEDNE